MVHVWVRRPWCLNGAARLPRHHVVVLYPSAFWMSLQLVQDPSSVPCSVSSAMSVAYRFGDTNARLAILQL